MKAVVLAGGLGTRLSEETETRPKPMVEIGGRPILWHVMKIYSAFGVSEFIVCCGYKGYVIKEYFANYFLHMSDVTFDLRENEIRVHENYTEPWKVTLVDTGEQSMTGGRLRRIKDYVSQDDFFLFTYGDGVGDINMYDLVKFHQNHGKLATLTATRPPSRFGALSINAQGNVTEFQEKPDGDEGWINGGFFVLSPKVIDRIVDDATVWEHEPMASLAVDGELMAYTHDGFWQPMDTIREKKILESLWEGGNAPWKVW